MDGQFVPGAPLQFEGVGSPRNPWHKRDLNEIITSLGLTSGRKLVLDAGDSSSYSGSGQSWLDLSGNGYDFFRGATSAATTDDPTFNGSAGTLSAAEYWSFDGGDKFRYDTTNETWMQNLHKNNALFSLVCWFYLPDLTAMQGLFGTCSNSSLSNTGAQWIIDTSGNLYVQVLNGSGSSAAVIVGSTGVTASAWKFAAISVDEAANTAVGVLNGTVATTVSAYTSPSASNATYTAEIGATGNAIALMRNGGRIAQFAAWEGVALTQAQLLNIFTATRGRFGV